MALNMTRPSSIVFLDRGTLPVAMRTTALLLQWQEHESTPPELVVERLAQAEVAISNKVPLMAAQLSQLPKLKLIAVAATGTPHVAWASQQSLARLAEEVVLNIEAFYAGESRNRIV